MLAIGIDAEDISRFSLWYKYSQKSLSRIFTSNELEYCLANPAKSAERFAARWAAKEACYKALNTFLEPTNYSYFCKCVEITNERKPQMIIQWGAFKIKDPIEKSTIFLSLTHTDHTAIAVVIFA